MPAPGWKTICIREDTHQLLTELAGDLERSINWTADRAIQSKCLECYEDGKVSGSLVFSKESADAAGMR